MVTLKEAHQSFARPQRWSKDHKVQRRDIDEYEGSSREAKAAESSHGIHRIGRHIADGRRAGHLFSPEDDASAARVRAAEEREDRIEELIKKSKGEHGDTFVWSIADAKLAIGDEKITNPTHHGYARNVIHTTESDIKGQRWPGRDEQEKAAAEKKKQKDAEAKQGQDGSKEDNSDEDQSQAKSDSGDEKDSGYGSKESDDEEKDSSDDRELTPEEQEFLDKIKREIEEERTIAVNNDGEGAHLKLNDDQVEPTIDEQDQFMPDSWICRSDRLIRRTGQLPMNAEPDVTELFEAGLITPIKYHYVRNHGEVPRLDWAHTLEVFSDPPELMSDPRRFSMDELAKFDVLTLPVTLSCDGNRRGEVNRVKRSTGFDWGPGATSCVYWTGPLLRDVLNSCGVKKTKPEQRLYVHYEGADVLSEGKYGTSIPFEYAMDPTNDVMLAMEMNGRPLHPDHGYPIRSIIPGFVGGRCVKWLAKIWVSDKPSLNHYHIYDNRLLPSFVTDNDSLEAKAFFHSFETIINEQPLQSVIAKPAHLETIALDDREVWSKKYTLAGYAMAGAGVPVQRIEVSLDEGKNWRYAWRKHVPGATQLRHGTKTWAWVHWQLEVAVSELVAAKEISVRAWDSHKNVQRESIEWSISGMMNNAYYRIKPRFEVRGDDKKPVIIFEHPCMPGHKESEGWMKVSAEEQAKHAAEEASAEGGKEFIAEEIQKHASTDDCWLVLNNKVYDVTSVLKWHPGGSNAILAHAGKVSMDASQQYNAIHDGYANRKRDECLIGQLTKKGIEAMHKDAERVEKQLQREAQARKGYAIKKHRWTAFKLASKEQISEDTFVYKFSTPDGKKLGLPIGAHVGIGIHMLDSMIVRQYTPIHPVLPDEEDGEVHLLIKSYLPDRTTDDDGKMTAKFPPGGSMTTYLTALKEGEELDFRGPLGEIHYVDRSTFSIDGQKHKFSKLNLVAGGSGITPHYQLIHAIVKDKDDPTEIRLINCDAKKSDVLLYDELLQLEKDSNGRFKMWVILSHPDKKDGEWKQGTGHLDDDAMKEHFFEAGEEVASFLCGPPGLISHAAQPGLQRLGFKDDETLFGF